MKKYINKIIAACCTILLVVLVVAYVPKDRSYTPMFFYNRSGLISRPMKVFCDTITPSTGNGYSLDISAAGFSSVVSVSAIVSRNTTTATSVPNIGIKTISTSAIVFNITEGNATLINLLGSNVLLGPATTFSSNTGLLLSVTVIGY